MKIGLVGYFGWGNYGDEIFLEIFKEKFSNHDLVLFHDPVKGALLENVELLINSVDAIIIGGGDLLMPFYRSWLYWDERFLVKPIFIFGIGVPTWGGTKSEVLEYYQHFLSHENIKLISCRDDESVKWIESNLKINKPISMYPDMVIGLDFPQKNLRSKSLGIILRKQDTYKEKNILKACSQAAEMGLSIKLLLLGTDSTLHDDMEILHNIKLPNVDIIIRDSTQKLTHEIANCRYIVSMKFHGIVAAYKCGVPFISLSGADKFVSFMKQTGNEKYLSSWDDEKLLDKLESLCIDGMNFSNREKLAADANKGLEQLVQLVNNIEQKQIN